MLQEVTWRVILANGFLILGNLAELKTADIHVPPAATLQHPQDSRSSLARERCPCQNLFDLRWHEQHSSLPVTEQRSCLIKMYSQLSAHVEGTFGFEWAEQSEMLRAGSKPDSCMPWWQQCRTYLVLINQAQKKNKNKKPPKPNTHHHQQQKPPPKPKLASAHTSSSIF